MIKYSKPELLSPAGSKESVYAAVNAGCNAVYLGGKSFSARSSAANFDHTELREAIDFCHLRGVKVYIAINTLYKDSELQEVFEFLSYVYEIGADAFILQDIGTAVQARKVFPEIALHASTQMTAHSLEDVLFLEKAGFCRAVLSRELSLEEIGYIKRNTSIELEVFVHGALCVCYSGQCLMSSIIGGRSGNRGSCAQPCRLQYDLIREQSGVRETVQSGYLLSPKDQMTIDGLDGIVACGISSLKIEGRMKSPEYVGVVTKAYANRLDSLYSDASYDGTGQKKRLVSIFNRGGFSEGYFKSYSGSEMMSIYSPKNAGLKIGRVEEFFPDTGKCIIVLEEDIIAGDGIEIWSKPMHTGTGISKNQKKGEKLTVTVQGNIQKGDLVHRSYDKALNDEAKKLYETDIRKINVSAKVQARMGERLCLSLQYRDIKVQGTGSVVEKARNQPMSPEKILSQLSKTGNTPFVFDFELQDIDTDIFIPVSELNELRRATSADLEQAIINANRRVSVAFELKVPRKLYSKNNEVYSKGHISKNLCVAVQSETQLVEVLNNSFEGIDRVYFEYVKNTETDINYYCREFQKKGVKLYAALPDVERAGYGSIEKLEHTEISGYLARTYGSLLLLANSEKDVIADYSLNVSNALSYRYISQFSSLIALSTELNFKDINELYASEAELILYGKPKMMVTVQCPVGLYDAKKKEQRFCVLKKKHDDRQYYLKDRKGIHFPVLTNCEVCNAYIVNDRPLFLFAKFSELDSSVSGSYRISFTDENGPQIQQILSIAQAVCVDRDSRRTAELIDDYMSGDTSFTYGHYFKGSL